MKLSTISLIFCLIICSCKKEEVNIALSSISVINAVVGGSTIKLGTYSASIFPGSYTKYSIYPGNKQLYIYPISDSTSPYFNSTIYLKDHSIYTLFISGKYPQIDTMLIEESLPLHIDSSLSVRIANLSPNSNSISVNILGKPSGSEVTDLAYKGLSNFINYQTNKSTLPEKLTFEFRSSIDGSLMSTFSFSTMTLPHFKNVTLIFRGLVESPVVTRVNNY